MNQRILVMDDDLSICKICTLLLNRLGYDVDTVTSGESAVELYTRTFQEGKPYLAVILDLTVQTGMGGVEAIEKIRMVDPQVYAIMASGASMDKMVSSYQAYGFKAILPKPFRLQDVQQCMNAIDPTNR